MSACSLLTLNGGSSSIRFALYEAGEPLRRLLDGKMDRIGLSGTNLTFRESVGPAPVGRAIAPGDHGSALITTPFDMTVLNQLDRFHLVMAALDRLPQMSPKGAYLRQQLQDKLIAHKRYICGHGEDMPEIRNWRWSAGK